MKQVLLPHDRDPTPDEAMAYVQWLLSDDSVAMIRLGRGIDEGVLEVLSGEVARLREEVAALKRNRLAAFTPKEVADVATVLGDYLQQDDQEKAFLQEWQDEQRRREGSHEQ